MQSNSKLTKSQKLQLATMKANFIAKGGVFSQNEVTGITVCIRPAGSVYKMATSVKSPNEKKFRANVGLFNSLNNVLAGNEVSVPIEPSWHIQELADSYKG